MSDLSGDLRYALRGLRRSPLFAVIAVLTLALGIGATTAIFTLIDQVVLRRLPVPDAGTLVQIHQEGPHNGSNMGRWMNSYPMYMDFQQKGAPLSQVIARRTVSASLAVDNQTERVDAELVSGNFFTMLGVKPAAGRVLSSEEDDRVYNGHPVVVLSHDYWTNRFQGDPKVVGRKITVNNYPMTIVGVSAAGFSGLDPTASPDIRVPILMQPTLMPSMDWLKMSDRRQRWVQVFARLKPGYTAETAEPAMQGLFLQVRQHEMTLPAAKDWTDYGRKQFMKGKLKLTDASKGYSDLRNQFRSALIVLLCMVGLVLLIACGNVANLLIARGFLRQREIAVRLSIGASRAQLVRQLLIESLVLSFLGGVVGVALSVFFTRTLLAFIPSEGRSLLVQPTPDLRILSFAFFVTLVTGVIFGLLPALRASRPDPWKTLKDTVGSIAGGNQSLFLRKGLVTAQVALSFLLLFGAGLFTRSLQNLRGTDTGVREPENLISFQVDPSLSGYDDARGTNFQNQLLERIQAIPGVSAAGASSVAILAGDEWDSTMSVEGHKASNGEDMQAFMNALTPGYFKAMHVPMLAGRDFALTDQPAKWTDDAGRDRAARRHRQPASSPSTSSRPSTSIGRHIGWGDGPKIEAEHRDRRRRREPALRRSARRRPPAGVHSAHRQRRHRLLRAQLDRLVDALRPAPQRGAAHRQRDARLRHEDARAAARRDAAHRPPGRAPRRRLRPARRGAGLDRPLRRDGVRRGAAAQGAGDPARARRLSRRRHLDGDARGAGAARHRPGRRHSGRLRTADVCEQQGRHPAVWRPDLRPAGRRPDRAAADHGHGAGRPDPGAARQPHQPDAGDPLRVARTTPESRRAARDDSGVAVRLRSPEERGG